MGVRISEPGTVEGNAREGFQAEFTGLKLVLASEDDRRRNPMGEERTGDGLQFDGFGPGADDQPDVGETQPSP